MPQIDRIDKFFDNISTEELLEKYPPRNPDRIERILRKFAEIWVQYPDMRFGQLHYNLLRDLNLHDFFYVEDDLFESILDENLENLK